MELLELMRNRRSVRLYTGETVPEEKVEKVLQAALLSASGKAVRPWEFIVVRDKETIQKLSQCRVGVAKTVSGADVAIVVIADAEKSGQWIEDCSIAMANMYLMAESEGVGGCWIQCRERENDEGVATEKYLQELLGFPEGYRVLSMFVMGMPDKHPDAYELDQLKTEKIHYEKY